MNIKKDVGIISHLRKDARNKVTNISKNLKIPVTTIYDRIRSAEKRYIRQYSAILDFNKMGYSTICTLQFEINNTIRERVQNDLVNCPNVNTLRRINLGTEFIAETIFRNITDLDNFVDNLENTYGIKKIIINHINEDIKKESFLTSPEHFVE